MGSASIQRRLLSIKKLVKEYYSLSYGELIDKPTELLRLFTIKGSSYKEHPHKMHRVYISRKALKHFIESRKDELSKRHTDEQAIEIICFAIDKLQETITNFSHYELVPPHNHFYSKDYSYLGKPYLRILIEEKNDISIQIVSVHFTRIRK